MYLSNSFGLIMHQALLLAEKQGFVGVTEFDIILC